MQSFATRLLAPDYNGRGNGWFLLDNQMREKVVTNRISPSSRYHHRPGVDTYKPLCHAFPQSLKGFKWDMGKLVAKLKVKLREHAKGIAGYQFLAGCKLFRSEVPPSRRKGDRISAEDFRRVVEYRFGMKLDPDEVLALFHFLVPGTGESVEISSMVRVLEPDDYTDSWFNTRESTDMFGFTKPGPEKVVLQAKMMNVGGSWNLNLIEEKLREKIHERVGGTSLFEVQAAYSLFQDGRNNGLTKEGFKARMHDKFAVVLSNKDVDDVFRKYDPRGTGKLDVHSFVVRLVSPAAEPEPWFRGRDTYEFHVLNRAPMKKASCIGQISKEGEHDPMKADCWSRTNWTFRHFEETLRDKLLAKSNQDGGRFAFKSAVNLLRSANPDHLDSSHMDRKALKFVIFRRREKFDLVMDDHLLDEVFARFDPECSGKMPVHRLVQHLLPAKDTGSHHLVPKTDGQGQATKTLLGKIFGMTGKRREMISLNGSGVEDPQGESLLERMAAGDKGNGEVDLADLKSVRDWVASFQTRSLPSRSSTAQSSFMAKVTAALAAAAARRRDTSPLVFSGDKVDAAPGSAGKEAVIRAAATVARPETTSTNSGGSSSQGGGRGGGEEGWRGGDQSRGIGSSCGEPSSLLERERLLNAREMAVRQQEEAIKVIAEIMKQGDGGAPPTSVVTASAHRANMDREEAMISPRPPRRERERPASASVLKRHGGNRRQQQNHAGNRPASPARREIADKNNDGMREKSNNGRPRSALSSSGQSSIVARRAKQEEAALIARCRALGTAQRKAATAAAQRREELDKAKKQLDRQTPQATRTLQDGASGCSGTTVRTGTHPAVPSPISSPPSPKESRGGIRPKATGDSEAVGVQYRRSGSDCETAKTKATVVGRCDAAKASSRPHTSTRPRSASTSRSGGLTHGNTSRGEQWDRGAGRETKSDKVESGPESACREEYSSRGAAAHPSSCRPASAGLAVGKRAEHEHYRERLNSAQALQMRAMQRLQQRRAQSANKRLPERPPSGGCEGVSVGQFKSRYSGLDRFVLARTGEGTAAIQVGASRFGSGVPFYG
ncbi:unnamed protein product [Scytosiphon promiscuus]